MISVTASAPPGLLGQSPVREIEAAGRTPAGAGTHPAVREVPQGAAKIREEKPQDAALEEALKKAAPRPDISLRELSIRVLPDSNRVVVEVIDSETKTVVRQIPPEESLNLLRHLPRHRALLVDREG